MLTIVCTFAYMLGTWTAQCSFPCLSGEFISCWITSHKTFSTWWDIINKQNQNIIHLEVFHGVSYPTLDNIVPPYWGILSTWLVDDVSWGFLSSLTTDRGCRPVRIWAVLSESGRTKPWVKPESRRGEALSTIICLIIGDINRNLIGIVYNCLVLIDWQYSETSWNIDIVIEWLVRL